MNKWIMFYSILVGLSLSFMFSLWMHCWILKEEEDSMRSHLCVHSGLCAGDSSIPPDGFSSHKLTYI